MQVNIVIPVYKSTLTANEELSFLQCLRILGKYPLRIVLPYGLDSGCYLKHLKAENISDFDFEYFDASYFENVNAYSRLLLNKSFYKRFEDFDYILIYQLDAYVFRDELMEWCSRGYDYTGAPWFKSYGVHKKKNDLYRVGNGGVSLRKVSAFLSRFDRRMPLSIFPFMLKNIRLKGWFKMSVNTIKLLCVLLFYKPTLAHCVEHYLDERINEDCFWADGLSDTSLGFKKPEILEAACFCLEKSPSYLYDLIGNKLPFVCHAYEKYEYETFWKQFIP